MKLLWGAKDGGPESRVWCWGIESKLIGSILLLKFARGSREAFHTHAFNSISWVLSGALIEDFVDGKGAVHVPSFRPVRTYRETNHQVSGEAAANWALTLRGPWTDRWSEFLPRLKKTITLTHGRREV